MFRRLPPPLGGTLTKENTMSETTQQSTVEPLEVPRARLSVTVPAGRYWVGDPCYSIPNDLWMSWLEAADYTFPGREHVLAARINGRVAVGVSTKYGDGCYPDEQGRMYAVDAGLIGVVPVEVADNSVGSDGDGEGGRIIDFPHEFECYYDDGTVVLGPVRIHTGDDEFDWRDDWDEDED
jgi:hypothetical protein